MLRCRARPRRTGRTGSAGAGSSVCARAPTADGEGQPSAMSGRSPGVPTENTHRPQNPWLFGEGLDTVLSMYATVFLLLLSALRDSFRGRAALQLEFIALRHQLATMKRNSRRPSPRPPDRLLWVLLSRLLPNWREMLVIVKPETVIGGIEKASDRTGRGSRGGAEADAHRSHAMSAP